MTGDDYDDMVGCGCGCLTILGMTTAGILLLTALLVAIGWFFDAWDALGGA